MELIASASRSANRWVEQILAWFGMSMALIVALQVFCRYVLNYSLFWSEELARYLLVWLTFLGATAAYYHKAHPGLDLLTQRLNKSILKFCRILVHLISLTLFVVMIYYGTTFAYFIRAQISPALAIPKWIIFSIIPISGALFVLHCIHFILAELLGPGDDS